VAAVRCQQLVEQRDRGMGPGCRPGPQRVLPADLKGLDKRLAHPVRDVRIEAAHARHLVAEALLGQDVRDAVLGHPGPVAVPEPVRGQAGTSGGQEASGTPSGSILVQASATTVAASRTAALPVSVRRNRRSGVSRRCAHAVRSENGEADAVGLVT
jgi:hypothetical protein